jgi:hypothetical protein
MAKQAEDGPRNAPLHLNVVSKTKQFAEGGRWVRNAPLARYLNISKMTLWRWSRDPELNFPPAAVVNDIEYRNLDAVDAWMRSRFAADLEKETA